MKETEQIVFWKGEFGDDYTDRNSEDFNQSYKELFGITRSELNKEFLGMLGTDIVLLEVGCNRGSQLQILKKNGFKNLWGLEINKKALETAREDKTLNLVEGSAMDIPFKDSFFDLTFTSGVLIHISPDDLPKAIDEIYRTSKRYIWCFEYFSKSCEEIEYRGHKNRLWKNNFPKLFLDRHPDLKIIKKKELKRLKDENIDVMFLMEKKR